MKKALVKMTVLAGLMALSATAALAAPALGPHQDSGATNPCKRCHDTAAGTPALRGWAGTITAPAGSWGSRPISGLCYTCHSIGGGPLSTPGHNMSNNAFADSSHLFTVGNVPEEPEGAAQGTTFAAISDSGLPYTTAANNLNCTSCHNVHVATSRPFNQRATYQGMCNACHDGRQNNGATVGGSIAGASRNFSTHPTQVNLGDAGGANIRDAASINANLRVALAAPPGYALGGHLSSGATGQIDCHTCHAVHGPTQGTAGVNNLLAIDNDSSGSAADPSALCEGCHFGGDSGEQVGTYVAVAGEFSDHPIDASNNQSFYPTGVALPANWGATNPNNDRGAQPFYIPGSGQATPVCSSCHDTHGGIAATPILRGPGANPMGGLVGGWDIQGTMNNIYDNWCFSCHTNSQVIPQNHHSVMNNLNASLGHEYTSQISCGDCHGAGGTQNWTAHNGFWRFVVALSATNSSFCEGCHTATDPRDLVSPSLIKGTTFTEPANFPATHGVVRGTGNGSSHQVNSAATLTNTNMQVNPSWAFASNGSSQWGASSTPICESCHNILTNGVAASRGLINGWQANLLLAPYEDDDVGVAQGEDGPSGTSHDFYGNTTYGAGATGVDMCRACHRGGAMAGNTNPVDMVHNPEAHTRNAYTFNAASVPYGRAAMGVLTDVTAACPDLTTADAGATQTTPASALPAAPGQLSYPAVNAVNCDSCHRPHSAAAASLDSAADRWLVLEVTDTNWGTTICAQCHDTDVMCNQ